ncbi:hypothetical protein N7E70_024215 [Aminobacter sp. NyZ550]|uniref:Uncharacterized protein n=1 Tax=Aminobacter aganoensis TaxID=83264 RepID=A0A7X0F5S9_9HYPH|nr:MULTISPECIES: hypothetical protein [Aminobacter]MBB6353647.1 hypothetical protein [Aminobacter aganoensis]WAX94728.1 hypothetical protein N7E70_024215 [Aminobacter sp. NyZ550]
MKTASALLQILSLSALLAMHVAAPAEFRMPGVRKALQTINGEPLQPRLPEGLELAAA